MRQEPDILKGLTRRSFTGSALFERTFDEGMALVEETARYLDGKGREEARELPRKTSAAFVMHAIEDKGFDAIARKMKLTERMVRYHVARAMAHCRARLDAQEES